MSRRAASPGARRRAGSPRRGATPGRAARASGGWAAQVPYALVLAGGAAGLGWLWLHGTRGVRGGTLAMAGAMFAAALARLVLPENRAGMLVARKRFTDVIALAALAAGLLAAGLVLPAGL